MDPGVGKTFIRYYNNDYSLGRKEREPVLTIRDNSSLAVARLCDQAGGQKTSPLPVFTSTTPEGSSLRPGSLLKQMVSGIERIPEEISRAS